jgi:hypothetical protein
LPYDRTVAGRGPFAPARSIVLRRLMAATKAGASIRNVLGSCKPGTLSETTPL